MTSKCLSQIFFIGFAKGNIKYLRSTIKIDRVNFSRSTMDGKPLFLSIPPTYHYSTLYAIINVTPAMNYYICLLMQLKPILYH